MTEPTSMNELSFRPAGPTDARAIAELHADSWRRHYRATLSGKFLDGDVATFLDELWTDRFACQDPQARTVVATRIDSRIDSQAGPPDATLVGFAHTILDRDATWGALLDNLHVAHGLKGQGIGTRLLALAARNVTHAAPESGLYLWVYEANTPARAFYAARGGSCVERVEAHPPAGDPANLNGTPMILRISWLKPARLAAGAS